MANRLAESTSPYLLQHADNPVAWWPWSPEAFREAEERGVPVLISVGYAACHWCHVMAHESFEDAETAAMMNEHFVNIKVDREERPDVDAVYMEVTQAMTGHGGWPMTVFATPKGEPFFSGTYFPPTPRPGMPSFRQLLLSVARAWEERRAELEDVGADIVRRIADRGPAFDGGDPPTEEQLHRALIQLVRDFDAVRAGFGGAPKFPPSMTLEHLLRHHARTGTPAALEMVAKTCEAMARGGMYDQLGGGFARYSVDDAWVVPHFEKMLYDNALLLRVYTHWWRTAEAPESKELARRIALETADWMLRDLRTAEGGFASALDADSEGVEGKFYVWTPAELREALGESDGQWAAGVWGVTEEGTFEHGMSVLQLHADPEDAGRYADVRGRLLAVRARRVPPARDDKVVAAWNGLAIAGLAEAGALFDRPDLVEAAIAAADLLVALHLDGDRMLRTSRAGQPGSNAGVLEDYADLAEGFLALYAVTSDEDWLTFAGVLLDSVLAHFADGRGGFYDTADDAEQLVRRPQEATDNATPSGQAAAAGALLTYAAYTGSAPHRDAAGRALGIVAALADRYPRFTGWGLAVAEAYADGPREVAIVGPYADPATRALRAVALLGTAPGVAVAVGDPAGDPGVALLRDRPLVGGKPAAYVCRHFVCEAPITDPARLAEAVGARSAYTEIPASS